MKCCFNCSFYSIKDEFCTLMCESLKPHKVCYMYRAGVVKNNSCLYCVHFVGNSFCNYGSISALMPLQTVSKEYSCPHFHRLLIDMNISPVSKKFYKRNGFPFPLTRWNYKKPELSVVDWTYFKLQRKKVT